MITKKKLVAFVSLLAFCAALAWLTGFDFDRRGGDVAYFTFSAIILSFVMANLIGEIE